MVFVGAAPSPRMPPPARVLELGQLNVEIMGLGYAWLDTGTHLQFARRRADSKAGRAAGQKWLWAVFAGFVEVSRPT
jgi:hypothetical protein